MSEIVGQRTINSKTFDLGGQKRRLSVRQAPFHYLDDNEQLQDIDLTPEDRATEIVFEKGWYKLNVSKTEVRISYESRILGFGILTLSQVDDVDISGLSLNIAPTIEDRSIWYRELLPDLDIEIRLSGGKVEWFKYLKSETAPRTLSWDVEHSGASRSFRVNEISIGWDSKPTEVDLESRRRWADLDLQGSNLTGRTGRRLREEFKNAVMDVVDPVTRKRVKRTDVVYPVIIDADIEEDITSNTDDGHQYSANKWNSTTDYIYFTGDNAPAWRFQAVAFPAGATVDDASLTIVCAQTASQAGTLYGEDVDSAAAWVEQEAQAGPMDMALTSASVTFDGFGTPGDKVFTVTDIIAEIVVRPGWATGQDMRLGATEATSGADTCTFKSRDYAGVANAGQLDINYTVGGAAPISPYYSSYYLPQVVRAH